MAAKQRGIFFISDSEVRTGGRNVFFFLNNWDKSCVFSTGGLLQVFTPNVRSPAAVLIADQCYAVKRKTGTAGAWPASANDK